MNTSADIRRKIAASVGIFLVPFYAVCGIKHICMDGHMRHPPYSLPSMVNDAAWILFATVALVLSVRSNLHLKRTFIALIPFLSFSRLALGSGGGGLFVLELPAMILLATIGVRGLRLPATNWKEAKEEDRVRHSIAIKRRWKWSACAVIAVVVTVYLGVAGFRWFREFKTPRVVVSPNALPYSREFKLKNGEAISLQLPNGKQLSFWCDQSSLLLDNNSLSLAWGEKPFVRPEIRWEKQPNGSRVSGEWESYIRAGGVTTWSGSAGHEYKLFVDGLRVTLRDDGGKSGTLVVRAAVQ